MWHQKFNVFWCSESFLFLDRFGCYKTRTALWVILPKQSTPCLNCPRLDIWKTGLLDSYVLHLKSNGAWGVLLTNDLLDVQTLTMTNTQHNVKWGCNMQKPPHIAHHMADSKVSPSSCKEWSDYPIWMNFRKTSKGGEGVSFPIQKIMLQIFAVIFIGPR